MLFISEGIMDVFVKKFDVEEAWMARRWRMVEKLSGFGRVRGRISWNG